MTALNHRGARRAVGLLATPALALATLAALPAAPSYAAEPDSAPVAAGATWLEAQLTDGVVHNDQYGFDDLGLTVDVGLGLDAVGGHDAVVQDVADTIASNVDSYTSYQAGATPDTTHVLAGSYAKALALAVAADRDGRAFGGKNLVTGLEGQVATEGAIAGRIQDTYDATVPFESDFANTIGQAFAVQGLDAEASTLVDPVTDFLLAQQCSEGFFRLNFAPAEAAEQTCEADPEAAPDTDVTALAVVALQSQTDDTDVQAAVTKATDWLVAAQGADGSFGGGTSTESANANSTGLAAWALGVAGETEAAGEAATWVAALQTHDVSCSGTPLASQTGAIAYDAAGLAAGQSEGITAATRDQWRRASAQALPGLLYLPSAPAASPLALTAPSGYRAAGSKVTLGLTGLASGEEACVGGVPVTGPATSVVVTLPAGTATRTFRSDRFGAPSNAARVDVLGAKKLGLALGKARVAKGRLQSVRVSGMAPRERVSVWLRGRKVDTGRANSNGVFATRVKVTGALGKAKVKAAGQFANRQNTKTFTVTR